MLYNLANRLCHKFCPHGATFLRATPNFCAAFRWGALASGNGQKGTSNFYPVRKKLGFSLWAKKKVKRVIGISYSPNSHICFSKTSSMCWPSLVQIGRFVNIVYICEIPKPRTSSANQWVLSEILIKFLESRVAVFSVHMNVIKIIIPKNGGHFERQAAIGQRNMPLNSYLAVSRTQKTSSC